MSSGNLYSSNLAAAANADGAEVNPNVGDFHGQFAAQDYYWGPSISWNTHLQKYIVLLSRSNDASFAWTGGQTNYVAYLDDLALPAAISSPVALQFPETISATGTP